MTAPAAAPASAVAAGLDALPLRDDLRGLTPYGAPQLDVPVRLNTNENPYPPSGALVAALSQACAAAVRSANRYPDREATLLRADLAAFLGRDTGVPLAPAQLWAANGSNEVLQQLCQAFGGPGRTAMGFEPSYSMHPLIALGTSTGWIAGRREDDFSLHPGRVADAVRAAQPSVVFLCSPNNPTGTALPADVVAAVADVATGIVVVDEAYAEFRQTGVPSAVRLLAEYPRLVVTRTMSKAFSFAGVRLGYLAASADVVDALRLVRLPYHLSSLTQAAARTALAFEGELLATVAGVRAERDRLVLELRAMGLTAVDSDANFVLIGRFADQHTTWQALVDRGVLIRDPGVPGWLRVTVGLPEENNAFLSALREVLP